MERKCCESNTYTNCWKIDSKSFQWACIRSKGSSTPHRRSIARQWLRESTRRHHLSESLSVYRLSYIISLNLYCELLSYWADEHFKILHFLRKVQRESSESSMIGSIDLKLISVGRWNMYTKKKSRYEKKKCMKSLRKMYEIRKMPKTYYDGFDTLDRKISPRRLVSIYISVSIYSPHGLGSIYILVCF